MNILSYIPQEQRREQLVKLFLTTDKAESAINAITPEPRTHQKRKKEKEREAMLVKQILSMAYLENRTTKEISEKLSLSERHIRTLKRRGYALIKLPVDWEQTATG